MRAFIVGNGPSLVPEDLDRIVGEIAFASNYINLLYDRTVWRPRFWVTVETPNFFETMMHLDQGYRCFLTTNRADKVERHRSPFRLVENLSYLPACEHIWQFKWPGKHPPATIEFGDRPHPICMYGGSGIASIQLAIMGGFSPIVLLGHDGLYLPPDESGDRSHFDRSYLNEHDLADEAEMRTATMLDAHEKMSAAAKVRGVEIINATRGGILESYPRVVLEEIL